MIAIRSNKELYFPDGKGFVTMRINMIQNNPDAEIYTMRLEDSCTRNITDTEGDISIVNIGTPRIRFKTMTYSELDILYDSLNMDNVNLNMREKINESFRQGLLLVTQQECINGINGEEGKGQYYSEAQDWEIIRSGEE